jgi:imidazole glycerol-phosphate synthase subunit HisH
VTLALVNIRSGNLASVANALRVAGAGAREVAITADPDAIARAERVVLPGVGAFGTCAADGLEEALGAAAAAGTPLLGICVGMQLMAQRGEEHGEHRGLGWFDGTVTRLAPGGGAKVPHMGWNDVVPEGEHPLLPRGEAYFLHSYAYEGADVAARTDHAGAVTAAIARDNLVGVQFHPEKSQRYGLELLERFLEWRP